MSLLVITLRLIHVVGGILWVGAAVFSTLFLSPAMQEAGPDAAKVGAGMMRRGMMKFMPSVAMLTILSGIWLYWRDSGGFSAAYIATPIGMTFLIGGALATAVFVVGLSVGMRSIKRMGVLQQSLASLPDTERAARMKEIGRLQALSGVIQRWGTITLVAAAAAMAIARYV